MSKNETLLMKRLVNRYNTIVNFFWSVLVLVPLVVFCYGEMSIKLTLIFLAASFITVFLPRSFFDAMQFKNRQVYKKIGVDFINRFTQNGIIVNNLVRKRIPGYQVISTKRSSIHKVVYQSYMFEKFHFTAFVFFLLTTIYALAKGFFAWSLVFFVSNIIYNVYPILLQQYVRARLKNVRNQQ